MGVMGVLRIASLLSDISTVLGIMHYRSPNLIA